MNAFQLRRSKWAKNFKCECPQQYEDAILHASTLKYVKIEKLDDHSFVGDFVWAIMPDTNPEFWLDGLTTYDEAFQLCNEMNWTIND